MPSQSVKTTLVTQALSKILNTPHFKSSKILAKFLNFVVRETLDGKEQYLKEYVIGTQVLKKDSDFNPQIDAIVRIHARRLRNLLEEYYHTEGVNDPIRISMPTGRYIPVFEKNEPPGAHINGKSYTLNGKPPLGIPKIAIMPLTQAGSNERLDVICASLCRDLSIELSRCRELSMISNYSIQMAQKHHHSMEEIIEKLQPDYLIMATCYISGSNFKSAVELHSVKKNQMIWGESYEIDDCQRNEFAIYREIIKSVLMNISGFLGIIYRDLLLASSIPDDYNYMYAVYWHNKYHSHFSVDAFMEASAAIDLGLQKNPDNSLLNSIKAQMLLDQKTMETDFEIDPLSEAMKYVTKAVSLDQRNQHAWMILAWANLMAHNRNRAIESMEKSNAINPNSSLYQGNLGFGYVCAGEYDKGFDLLMKSIQFPYYIWVSNVGLCLYHIATNEYEEAHYWARLIDRPQFVWDPLLRLCCAGHLNMEKEIPTAKKELLDLSPQFQKKAKKLIGVFLLDKILRNTVIEGLQKAGIIVD